MEGKAEWIVARTGFPLAITGAIAAAIALLNVGGTPDMVTGVTIFTSYVLVATVERLVPLHGEWARSHGDVGPDIGLGLTNGLATFIVQPLFFAAAVGLATWLSTEYGTRLWPTQWPLIVQLVPALLIGELVEYSVHRSMHEVSWLWPLHAAHHSSKRLYWLNALRFHPLDILAVGPGKLVPLVMLGADGSVLALVGIFSAVHGVWQHANIPCRIGPLNWIFSMAELHRWHHSPVVAEANHNYGGNLIFWDIVFGTRWLPKDRKPPVQTGIGQLPNFPDAYHSLLMAPFRWHSVVREAGENPPASLSSRP